jgi:aryl-alcohol dehydrogenase-like predicted oxidoreductase
MVVSMKYRRLGESELDVSQISLGSWLTFGAGINDSQSIGCVRQALDLGINFIDTANVYGRGEAESLLGKALKEVPRTSYVLGTKAYSSMGPQDSGLSRTQIFKQLDASLNRLRTDYVDLYQCHRYDTKTPLEETMRALSDVVEAGKVRYVGFSEWPVDKIRAAREMTDVVRFISSQPQYSMLRRGAEAEVIPCCTENGISQIVWSRWPKVCSRENIGTAYPMIRGQRASEWAAFSPRTTSNRTQLGRSTVSLKSRLMRA